MTTQPISTIGRSRVIFAVLALSAIALLGLSIQHLPSMQHATAAIRSWGFPITPTLSTKKHGVIYTPNKPTGADDARSEFSGYPFDLWRRRSPMRCNATRRPRPEEVKTAQGVWQVFTYIHGHSYIYSAFYDDRPGVGPLPFLRLLVKASFDKGENILSILFCHVWYKGFDEPFVVKALMQETGNERTFFEGFHFWTYTYSCPLAFAHPVPTHVSLTQDRCGESRVTTTYEPIHYSRPQEPPIEFGVCVACGFGNFPVDEVVEWFELQKLYGVTEFNLYDTAYHPNLSAVFNYYTRKGELRMFNMPHPLGLPKTYSNVKQQNLWPVPLDDCMLRNMYRYRYLVTLDFDELIVPRDHEPYTAMLRRVDKSLNLTRPFHQYTFRNLFFLREFPLTDAGEPLRSLRMRFRLNVSADLYCVKSFLNPLSCFTQFQHCCRQTLTGYEFKIIHAPNEIAMKHHYRSCPGGGCGDISKLRVQDDMMLKIKPKLLTMAEPVLKALREG